MRGRVVLVASCRLGGPRGAPKRIGKELKHLGKPSPNLLGGAQRRWRGIYISTTTTTTTRAADTAYVYVCGYIHVYALVSKYAAYRACMQDTAQALYPEYGYFTRCCMRIPHTAQELYPAPVCGYRLYPCGSRP